MSPENIAARLADLARLEDGWDADHAAPKPSDKSIEVAGIIASLAAPDEIDPDATGGVALWWYGRDGRNIWIHVWNDGHATAFSQKDA